MVATANFDFIPSHPKGTQARVLLSSVFGPYARDDEFGSRSINPMELYHNQVTREQGSFSLRMFHRSWGLMMIQRNISAPSTLLDFPTLERFEHELTSTEYDIVGISGIIPNFGKVREMCRRVRRLSPNSTIIVGGHVAAIPGLDKLIDADHIVRGEGIPWMRRYLGEDPGAPIEHPEILSGFGMRVLGMRMPDNTLRHGRHDHPLGGMPHGLQLLHHVSLFWRQGQERPLLRIWRSALRSHGAHGALDERAVVLHDGREFLAESAARHATAGPHERSREGLVALCLLVGQRDPQVHH